jgi:hypothetical protein
MNNPEFRVGDKGVSSEGPYQGLPVTWLQHSDPLGKVLEMVSLELARQRRARPPQGDPE